MSGRGGVYEGPGGVKLYGDGREVDSRRSNQMPIEPNSTAPRRDAVQCQTCFDTGFHRRAHESTPCPNGCASKLKPRPFCGNAESILDCLTDDDEYFVHCPSCNVQQIANHTRESAIKEWNRRA